MDFVCQGDFEAQQRDFRQNRLRTTGLRHLYVVILTKETQVQILFGEENLEHISMLIKICMHKVSSL